MTNKTPYYYTERHKHRGVDGKLKIVPHMFDIFEVRGDETYLITTISNRGDRLHNMLARGIPLDIATKLFYEMDD